MRLHLWTFVLLAVACSDTGPGGEQHCSPVQSCPSGQVCISGVGYCVVPEGCVQGDICGTTCTNTRNDPMNCGNCGTICSGQTPLCANRQCVAVCPTGLISCNNGCVDFARDLRNCGSCGHACGPLQACESGVCTNYCNAPLADCSGVCINPGDDANNCGNCGHVCPSTASFCSQGTCVASCTAPLVTCDKSCVNLMTDVSNCGECRHKCDPGESCQNGQCH